MEPIQDDIPWTGDEREIQALRRVVDNLEAERDRLIQDVEKWRRRAYEAEVFAGKLMMTQ